MDPSRRDFLALAALSAAQLGWGRPPRRDHEATPPGFEGPFYPLDWPREPADFSYGDGDADLLWVNGEERFAEGVVLELSGRVLDLSGNPLHNIEIDIWQVDANGRYRHPADPDVAPVDPGFQGSGRAVTDGDGRYRFRTIRPVPYPGRTPHIHFKLKDACTPNLLTTQMYVAGEPLNEVDLLYQLVPEDRRRYVTTRLRRTWPTRLQGVLRRRERAHFDIVLGAAPCDSV